MVLYFKYERNIKVNTPLHFLFETFASSGAIIYNYHQTIKQ